MGKALDYLLELRMERGPLGPEQAAQELLAWAEAEGLGAGGSPPEDG